MASLANNNVWLATMFAFAVPSASTVLQNANPAHIVIGADASFDELNQYIDQFAFALNVTYCSIAVTLFCFLYPCLIRIEISWKIHNGLFSTVPLSVGFNRFGSVYMDMTFFFIVSGSSLKKIALFNDLDIFKRFSFRRGIANTNQSGVNAKLWLDNWEQSTPLQIICIFSMRIDAAI